MTIPLLLQGVEFSLSSLRALNCSTVQPGFMNSIFCSLHSQLVQRNLHTTLNILIYIYFLSLFVLSLSNKKTMLALKIFCSGNFCDFVKFSQQSPLFARLAFGACCSATFPSPSTMNRI